MRGRKRDAEMEDAIINEFPGRCLKTFTRQREGGTRTRGSNLSLLVPHTDPVPSDGQAYLLEATVPAGTCRLASSSLLVPGTAGTRLGQASLLQILQFFTFLFFQALLYE